MLNFVITNSSVDPCIMHLVFPLNFDYHSVCSITVLFRLIYQATYNNINIPKFGTFFLW